MPLLIWLLRASKQPEAAVAASHNDVLHLYAGYGVKVEAVLTDNGREFCGIDRHTHELYLTQVQAPYRRIHARRHQANGFVDRFYRSVVRPGAVVGVSQHRVPA